MLVRIKERISYPLELKIGKYCLKSFCLFLMVQSYTSYVNLTLTYYNSKGNEVYNLLTLIIYLIYSFFEAQHPLFKDVQSRFPHYAVVCCKCEAFTEHLLTKC